MWTLSLAQSDPAVLLKEYSAQIVRGKYVLGSRIVRIGEVVTVQAVRGIHAEVTTAQNDRMVVLLADLRALPEPSPPPAAPAAKPARSPSPNFVAVPSPVPSPPAEPPPAPTVQTEVKAALEPIAERREVKVRCSHLTRKGKQCSRMTCSPNGLCWQHGGD